MNLHLSIPWHDIYVEAKSWQAAIGALLGFVALVCGAIVNYRLNRRRDRKLLQEDIVSIAAALYGEIVPLRHALSSAAAGVARRALDAGLRRGPAFDAYFLEMYPLPEPVLYRALSDKIGKLPADLLLPIMAFYAHYAEAARWMPQLVEKDERGFVYSEGVVLKPAVSAIEDILPALRRIETMTGVPTPCADLGTADARTILEMEDFRDECARADAAERHAANDVRAA